jgi:hypothetical protein
MVIRVLIGNTIQVGADLGGMAVVINLFIPLPIPILMVGLGSIILELQRAGATLHKSGQRNTDTAARAAEALPPLAGDAAGALFALGVIGVGFLAVPIMTAGAACDVCHGAHLRCFHRAVAQGSVRVENRGAAS